MTRLPGSCLASVVLFGLLMGSCSTPDGQSSEASSSPPASVADPSLADCPPMPIDLGTLMALERKQRLACFGDAALMFQAWVPEPFGAVGCPGDTVPGDGWLTACDPAGVALAPGPIMQRDEPPELFGVHLHPTTDVDPAALRTNIWVEVMGHFDDPAAQTCGRLTPDGQVVRDEVSIMQCRLEFVVTDVAPIAAP